MRVIHHIWLYATASCFRNKIWNVITPPLNSVNASTAHKAKYAERSDVAFLWLGLSSDPPVALVIPQRRPITPDLMKSMAHVCPFYAGIPPLFSVLFLPPCFVFSAAETINLQQSAEYLYLLTFPHFTSSVNQASIQRLDNRRLRTRKWQGCIICAILPSGMGARGVRSRHVENMEIFSCSPT